MPDPIPENVAAALNAAPSNLHPRLHDLRAIILAAATATNTAPLTETLKWGQPAYLPSRKEGTTIRLGWKPEQPDTIGLYVHCQTTLVDQYRSRFPTEFQYQNNRAVLIPATQPLNSDALHQIAALALTYHRNKTPK